MKTLTVKTNSGTHTFHLPNTIMEGDGFYVSYNDYDVDFYGSDTTALVLGQMERFYILNGDHRAQYQGLIRDGFDACLSYFKENLQQANKYSEMPALESSAAEKAPRVGSRSRPRFG